MTDNDIIKAFESLFKKLLNVKYELKITRKEFLALNRVDTLIKRQQSKIYRLTFDNEALRMAANSYKMHYNTAKTEAIKEFAERLKGFPQKCRIEHNGVSKLAPFIDDAGIDDLVKEMTDGV